MSFYFCTTHNTGWANEEDRRCPKWLWQDPRDCSVVRLRPIWQGVETPPGIVSSNPRRLVALLPEKECDNCAPPQGNGEGTACLGYHPETGEWPGEYEWGPCPAGCVDGWQLDADIRRPFNSIDSPVAVVPLEEQA